jgi:hypothetical protein
MNYVLIRLTDLVEHFSVYRDANFYANRLVIESFKKLFHFSPLQKFNSLVRQ